MVDETNSGIDLRVPWRNRKVVIFVVSDRSPVPRPTDLAKVILLVKPPEPRPNSPMLTIHFAERAYQLDTGRTDETPPVERTALDDLKRLADVGVTDASLEGCLGLEQVLLTGVAVDGALAEGGRITVLDTVLRRVSVDAMRQSLARRNEKPLVDQLGESTFQVAAAAELLGISDEAAFSLKRQSWRPNDAEWRIEEKKEENRGSRGQRQLRAGVWVEKSSSTIKRRKGELLAAFESRFKVYVASHQDELRELMNSHLAATIPPQSAQQPGSPNPAPPSPPAAKRKKQRILLSLSTAFVVTVGAALGLWWKWSAGEGEAEAAPLNVNTTWPTFRGCDGATMVAMQPGGSSIQSFPLTTKEDSRIKIAAASGGGSWQSGQLVIDLSGNTDEPVEIRNIHHKKLRELPAPKWVYEPRGGCGDMYHREFVLDLDGGRLFDKGVVGEASMLVDGEAPPPTELIGPAFTVSRSDPAQVTVNTLSCKGNYEWMLFIDYVQGSTKGTVTRGPYRSMGVAKDTEHYFTEDWKRYESEGKFSGSDPKRCEQILALP
ncbi:hypothetical protein [Streptomyces sp. AMCC400023]|uniref:hypothetical protein n=1 Tax=Streptomyces sp. AMCC400023 TaxID=2056258 RepID=UPI001F41CFE0|nr:hypothetical protein [Streptomyces sp. AMCC400023]